MSVGHFVEQAARAAEPVIKDYIQSKAIEYGQEVLKEGLRQGTQVVTTVAAQHVAAHATVGLCCSAAGAVATAPLLASAVVVGAAAVGVGALLAVGWGLSMLVEELAE